MNKSIELFEFDNSCQDKQQSFESLNKAQHVTTKQNYIHQACYNENNPVFVATAHYSGQNFHDRDLSTGFVSSAQSSGYTNQYQDFHRNNYSPITNVSQTYSTTNQQFYNYLNPHLNNMYSETPKSYSTGLNTDLQAYTSEDIRYKHYQQQNQQKQEQQQQQQQQQQKQQQQQQIIPQQHQHFAFNKKAALNAQICVDEYLRKAAKSTCPAIETSTSTINQDYIEREISIESNRASFTNQRYFDLNSSIENNSTNFSTRRRIKNLEIAST